MTEPQHLTYAAIITLALPGMEQPATVTVTLTPSTTIETAAGQRKPLRDCSLAELQAFADSLESELWAQYRDHKLGDLARKEEAGVKITLLDDEGQSRRLEPEAWLEHAIVLNAQAPSLEGTASRPVEVDESAQPMEVEVDEGDDAKRLPAETQEESSSEGMAAPVAETEQVEADEVTPIEAAQAEATPAEAPQETAPSEVEAPAVEEEKPTLDTPEEVAEAGEREAPLPPPPEETPVVPGPEPSTTPPGVEPPVTEREIRIAGLRRPLGHPTPTAVDILINEPTFRNTQAHALTSLNREVAGMLIGPQPEKQPDGRYVVHITDAIIAKHTRMHGASVTYTPESWRYVTDVLQERYPNEEAIIVGWYHTHPGFGIFLSGMDLFIHQNFFTQKWHVALVLDPLAHKSGFFCWDREQRAVHPYDFPWPPWAPGSW